MKAFTWEADDLLFEEAYNTFARRIFPWPGVPEPSWGGAWIVVPAGETTTPHAHDEKEVYLVVEGTGLMKIGPQERAVSFGDTIYVTPFVEHCLTNTGQGRLVFLSIWWDAGKATAADRAAAERLGS